MRHSTARAIGIRILFALAMAMALIALANTTFAAEETGIGSITAKGAGSAKLTSSGTITIAGGAGIVWVTGDADISTSGRGRRTTLPDGTIRLTGYSGTITISGESLVVRIEGGAINLTATGTGSVLLKGRGSYQVGDTTGTWSKSGTSVRF
ncbi:MAG: hypothetical protein OHK0050_09670 [Roseiflexaceae bacterium]